MFIDFLLVKCLRGRSFTLAIFVGTIDKKIYYPPRLQKKNISTSDITVLLVIVNISVQRSESALEN